MGADPYSEELIARYLLGDLPEAQQIQIEDRAFRDKGYRQNIVDVENDLIDEYVRHELSETELRQFEKRFLTSAERRARVIFARGLSTALSEAQKESQPVVVSAPVTWRDSLAAFVRGLAPAARFALAAAALVIFAGGAWLVTQTMRQRAQLAGLQSDQQMQQRNRKALERLIEAERKRNEDLASQLAQEKQQRQQSDELMNQIQRETENRRQPPAPTIVSLVLLPGISRSGSARPKLALPESARLAHLQIGIEPEEEYKTFRVELRTQDGRQVWTRDNLSARKTRSGKTVGLTLPARVLTAGQYELALKGLTAGGTTEDVGYYYFDVLKK